MDKIKKIFSDYNIDQVGFTHIDKLPPLIECRAKSRLPKDGKYIIGCLLPYYIGEYENRNISRYAIGTDYHVIAKEILSNICSDLKKEYPENEFVGFSDTSPIKEVWAAYYCGLGIIGKNKQLINNKYGSYVFIGTIITDLSLNLSIPIEKDCLNCGLCINSCPTKALSTEFNKEVCRSFITQKKGELSSFETIEVKNGKMIWGCDICSDICPLNKDAEKSPLKAMYENICAIVNMDNINNAVETKALGYRGKSVIERNINIVYGK